MYNPLVQDLSKFKTDSLELKITELMQKYSIAARLGQGGVCEQIAILLEHYKQELSRRHRENEAKLREKNQNFDDIINIDR